MAHILFLSFGSRGDVQPFIALGLEMQQRGHSITLAACTNFESLVTGYGLGFHPLPGDPEEISRLLNAAGTNPFRQMWDLFNYAMPLADDMIPAVYAAAEGAEAVVHTFAFVHTGYQLGHDMSIPDISIQFFPMFIRSGAFPNPAFPPAIKAPWANRLSHAFGENVMRVGGRLSYAYLRRRNDLPPWPGGWPFSVDPPTPLLLAMDEAMLPPFDREPYIHVSGYLSVPPDDTYTPPPDLLAFLQAGPPPVYIGFGSMIDRDMPRIVQAVRSALAQTGLRAVLSKGWGIDAVQGDSNLHIVGSIRHDWLLPRMAAAVHHGGAGTTAAVLRAGIPTLIVPFTGDQPFWGRQAHRLGCGPAPIANRHLTAENLAAALRTLTTDEDMQARAAEFGAYLRSQNGAANAADIIEQCLM